MKMVDDEGKVGSNPVRVITQKVVDTGKNNKGLVIIASIMLLALIAGAIF